jgi:hypothetical protein
MSEIYGAHRMEEYDKKEIDTDIKLRLWQEAEIFHVLSTRSQRINSQNTATICEFLHMDRDLIP